jgi:hypothetical protein
MNLNMEIGNIGNKKKSEVYPSKRHMNLYYKPDRTTKPATVSLYVLFGLVVLLGLAKLFIYDPMMEAAQLEEEYASYQNQLAEYEEKLTGFNEVQYQYQLYAATEDEQMLVDRMEILDLIDQVIRPVAQIESITIQDAQVLVQFSGVSLSYTGTIVDQLEQSSLVAETTVDTATTTVDGVDVVKVNILMTLTQTEAEAEAEAVAAGAEEAEGGEGL